MGSSALRSFTRFTLSAAPSLRPLRSSAPATPVRARRCVCVAIVGTIGIALLCGRVLFQTLQTHGLEALALWVAGLVTLSEGVAAVLGISLLRERTPIEIVDFQAGRNLVLRYASPLFLGLVSVGAWLGPSTSAMVAGGSVVGWVWTQSISGPREDARLATNARRVAAVLGLGMAAMLLRAAWKWST